MSQNKQRLILNFDVSENTVNIEANSIDKKPMQHDNPLIASNSLFNISKSIASHNKIATASLSFESFQGRVTPIKRQQPKEQGSDIKLDLGSCNVSSDSIICNKPKGEISKNSIFFTPSSNTICNWYQQSFLENHSYIENSISTEKKLQIDLEPTSKKITPIKYTKNQCQSNREREIKDINIAKFEIKDIQETNQWGFMEISKMINKELNLDLNLKDSKDYYDREEYASYTPKEFGGLNLNLTFNKIKNVNTMASDVCNTKCTEETIKPSSTPTTSQNQITKQTTTESSEKNTLVTNENTRVSYFSEKESGSVTKSNPITYLTATYKNQIENIIIEKIEKNNKVTTSIISNIINNEKPKLKTNSIRSESLITLDGLANKYASQILKRIKISSNINSAKKIEAALSARPIANPSPSNLKIKKNDRNLNFSIANNKINKIRSSSKNMIIIPPSSPEYDTIVQCSNANTHSNTNTESNSNTNTNTNTVNKKNESILRQLKSTSKSKSCSTLNQFIALALVANKDNANKLQVTNNFNINKLIVNHNPPKSNNHLPTNSSTIENVSNVTKEKINNYLSLDQLEGEKQVIPHRQNYNRSNGSHLNLSNLSPFPNGEVYIKPIKQKSLSRHYSKNSKTVELEINYSNTNNSNNGTSIQEDESFGASKYISNTNKNLNKILPLPYKNSLKDLKIPMSSRNNKTKPPSQIKNTTKNSISNYFSERINNSLLSKNEPIRKQQSLSFIKNERSNSNNNHNSNISSSYIDTNEIQTNQPISHRDSNQSQSISHRDSSGNRNQPISQRDIISIQPISHREINQSSINTNKSLNKIIFHNLEKSSMKKINSNRNLSNVSNSSKKEKEPTILKPNNFSKIFTNLQNNKISSNNLSNSKGNKENSNNLSNMLKYNNSTKRESSAKKHTINLNLADSKAKSKKQIVSKKINVVAGDDDMLSNDDLE